jgi:hypothetical protein
VKFVSMSCLGSDHGSAPVESEVGGQMTWARRSGSSLANDEDSRMGVIRAEEAVRLGEQNDRAVLTVAGHSSDVHDCTELLAMLGLDAGRRQRTA